MCVFGRCLTSPNGSVANKMKIQHTGFPDSEQTIMDHRGGHSYKSFVLENRYRNMPLVCCHGRCFADRRETVCQPCLWDFWESVGDFKEPRATPLAHPDVPGRPGEAPGTSGRPGEAGRSLWDVRKPRKPQGNSGELLERPDSPGRTGEVRGTSQETHVQGASRTIRETSGCAGGFPGPPCRLVRLPRCPPSHTDLSPLHEAKWTLLAQVHK